MVPVHVVRTGSTVGKGAVSRLVLAGVVFGLVATSPGSGLTGTVLVNTVQTGSVVTRLAGAGSVGTGLTGTPFSPNIR